MKKRFKHKKEEFIDTIMIIMMNLVYNHFYLLKIN